MERMPGSMAIRAVTGLSGDARTAALAAVTTGPVLPLPGIDTTGTGCGPAGYDPAMGVDWNGELAGQLESHWRHRLRPRLDGLTDEEYFWQPVPGCWTVSRRGASLAPASLGAGQFTWDFGEPQDPEPVTTIAWRLAHLIVGFAEMNGTHFGGRRRP